jgi:hypothetical protein
MVRFLESYFEHKFCFNPLMDIAVLQKNEKHKNNFFDISSLIFYCND